MLERVHESHLGIVKCKERARDVMYWPGMAKEIEDVVMKCSVCNKFKRNNTKEPLVSHEIPDRAWAKVGVDLFHYNQGDYLMCLLKPQIHENAHKNIKDRQLKQKHYFDRGAKHLPTLEEGEKVRVKVKDNWQPATVLKSHDTPRSFVIKTPDGNTYRRNRRHLLKTREKTFTTQSSPHPEDYDPGERQPAERDASFQIPASSPVKVSAPPTVNEEVVKRSRVGRVIKPPSPEDLFDGGLNEEVKPHTALPKAEEEGETGCHSAKR
ncbi:hypothetical protein N1851_003464 [Merluccius polli]|uniref:Gypsy retrotransposon integrase-like protein 1 n=1 Tax=Merluccius polli TaxID=89951 RepID=A0AA47PBL7_MERPO|nr:hypothetical protein N1851_003464 [Merluccius polli]